MKHISQTSKKVLIDIAISQTENSSKKSKLNMLWEKGIISNDDYYNLIKKHSLIGA